jgi:hypothetical protein
MFKEVNDSLESVQLVLDSVTSPPSKHGAPDFGNIQNQMSDGYIGS